jgi:hypothetical protein
MRGERDSEKRNIGELRRVQEMAHREGGRDEMNGQKIILLIDGIASSGGSLTRKSSGSDDACNCFNGGIKIFFGGMFVKCRGFGVYCYADCFQAVDALHIL